jgi:hypothetical protein
MYRHATPSISPRTGSSVPFGKPSRPGLIGRAVPLLFAAGGFAMATVALVTGLVPELPEALSPISDLLERAGLDKGPLAVFGTITIGVALVMRRSWPTKDTSSERLAEQLERGFQAVETQFRESGATIEMLRHDILALQQTVKSGFETTANSASSSQEAGNDRIFRLAASLDQLGAQVDRRLDLAHDELKRLISTSADRTCEATDRLMSQLGPAGEASLALQPADEPVNQPIYGGSSREAMASFMDDLRSLPQDLVSRSEELDLTATGESGADLLSEADMEAAAALSDEELDTTGTALNEELELIDRMEQASTATPPLPSEGGHHEG